MLKRFTLTTLMCLIATLTIFLSGKIDAKSASIVDFVVPANFTFEKDLRRNSSAIPDMYFLQNLLNMSTSTRVADAGPGSNTGLTVFYGEKTENAIDRFQKLFKNDLDYEVKLSKRINAFTYFPNPKRVDNYARNILNKLIIIYSDDLVQFRQSTSTIAFTITKDSENKDGLIYNNGKNSFSFSSKGKLAKIINDDTSDQSVFSYNNKDGKDNTAAIVAGAAGATALIAGIASKAASTNGLFNFGGKTVSMTVCTCSANILLYVQDVRGVTLPLIYQPFVTVLYKMYEPVVGVNVLGRYVAGGQCLIYVGTGCSTGGLPFGTMIQLGTSAL